MADTITRILDHYSKTVEEYVNTIKPLCMGNKWGCDGKEKKVRGAKRWIVTVMCIATRFILA